MTSATETRSAKKDSLKLKGSLLPFTIIELGHTDTSGISEQLAAKVSQAPLFFESTPVVISLENLPQTAPAIDFADLISACRENGMIPVAVRGGSDIQHSRAIQAGLALLPRLADNNRKGIDLGSAPGQPETGTDSQPANTAPAPARGLAGNPNRIIYQPVRSGQQIYAPGGDLVILSSVSPGAEVLADGNIHIYGPLRGRALAGVKGDTSARIFCQSMEAELISVAGSFMISEDMDKEYRKKPVQICLKDGRLLLAPL